MRLRRLALGGLLLVLIIVAALLVVASTICACAAPPTLTLTPGAATTETRSILFASNRDGDWDLYTMSLADRSVTNLTHNTADDGFGSYSADGGAITFLSNRDGALNPYMMDADGGNPRAVANDLGTILSVLGSGRINWDLSYRTADQAALVSLRDLNLEVYSRDASGEHNLTHNGAVDWFPAWSPDGAQIAFSSDRDGNQEIYVMNADGSNPRRLTNAPGDDLYPMWWNDRIVFMSDSDVAFASGQIGLYTVRPADASPQVQRLSADTSVEAMDRQLWPSDGAQLYASNRSGHWDIYLADSAGGNAVDLTAGSGDNLFPVWQPQA